MHSDDDRRMRSMETPYMPLGKREGFWGDSPVPMPRPTAPSGVPSEKRLRRLESAADRAPMTGFIAYLPALVLSRITMGSPLEVQTVLGCATGVIIYTVATIIVGIRASRKLYHYYEEVLLGTIVKRDIIGGCKKRDLEWVITIEGYNRMGQLRKCTHAVSAGDWHDKYRVGEVVDLTSS